MLKYRRAARINQNLTAQGMEITPHKYSRLESGKTQLLLTDCLAFCNTVGIKPETFINSMYRVKFKDFTRLDVS